MSQTRSTDPAELETLPDHLDPVEEACLRRIMQRLRIGPESDVPDPSPTRPRATRRSASISGEITVEHEPGSGGRVPG